MNMLKHRSSFLATYPCNVSLKTNPFLSFSVTRTRNTFHQASLPYKITLTSLKIMPFGTNITHKRKCTCFLHFSSFQTCIRKLHLFVENFSCAFKIVFYQGVILNIIKRFQRIFIHT